MSRAAEWAGCDAVAFVVAHNQFKSDFSRFFNPFGICKNDHTLFRFCWARTKEFFAALELLEKENSKIPKAKELVEEYKDALKQKDNEIEKLKRNNQELYESIKKLPKFIRKIFIKDIDTKLLN